MTNSVLCLDSKSALCHTASNPSRFHLIQLTAGLTVPPHSLLFFVVKPMQIHDQPSAQ